MSAAPWFLSFWVEKDDPGGRLSQFRLILTLFAVGYVRHWPGTVAPPDVALAVAILFALPLRALFRLVPAAEAVSALRVFFEGAIGRGLEAARAAAAPSWGSVGPLGPLSTAPAPVEGPGTLTAADLAPPVAHGRPDDPEAP